MMNYVELSPALETRMADLKARMHEACITETDMKTFQRVAAVMGGDSGRIDSDDLIAASFLHEGKEDG